MTYPTLPRLISSVFCCTRSCYKSSFIFLSLPDSKFQSVVTIWIIFLCFHCHICIHPYQHSLSHSAYHSFSHSLLFYFILFYFILFYFIYFARRMKPKLNLLMWMETISPFWMFITHTNRCSYFSSPMILVSSSCLLTVMRMRWLPLPLFLCQISFLLYHTSFIHLLCCVVLLYSRWWFTIP